MFLQMAGATGARRGEVLALRWSDIKGREVVITRSLTQTRQVLIFKGTKTEKPRERRAAESVLAPLAAHREQQEKFRLHFGPDYRADLDLIFANPPIAHGHHKGENGRPGMGIHTGSHCPGGPLLSTTLFQSAAASRIGDSTLRHKSD